MTFADFYHFFTICTFRADFLTKSARVLGTKNKMGMSKKLYFDDFYGYPAPWVKIRKNALVSKNDQVINDIIVNPILQNLGSFNVENFL